MQHNLLHIQQLMQTNSIVLNDDAMTEPTMSDQPLLGAFNPNNNN